MQDDPPRRYFDPNTQLQKTLAQGADLCLVKTRPRGQATPFLHQDVGGSRHKHAQLIGPEAGAACAIEIKAVMQFLDAVFGVSAVPIDLVHILGFVGKIGDDEAGIVLRVTPRVSDDFGFDDDAPTEKVVNSVFDHVGIAFVEDTCRQTPAQLQLRIHGFDQDGTAVGTAIVLVEAGVLWLRKEVGKENRLCGRVIHRRPLAVYGTCVDTSSYTLLEALRFSE